jgi:very-short-patch-repair endonuclease
MKIPYNPKLKALAKELRKNSTLGEVLLWTHLKGKQMRGYDFHRQKPILDFIVDFYCPKLKLVLEVDGESHAGKFKYDSARDSKLKALGLHVLRFREKDVQSNLNDVLEAIARWIEEHEKRMCDK